MFVIFFAIFIFVLTIWENIWLSIVVFGILFVGLLVFVVVKNRTKPCLPADRSSNIVKYRKMFLLLFITFFLAVGCWFWKNNSLVQNPSSEKGSFMGTGVIQDTYTQGKYIFTDGKGSYILYSNQEYQIGENIFLVGRWLSGTASGSADQQGFLAFDYGKRLKMKGRKGTLYETNAFVIQQTNPGRIHQAKKNLQQKIISAYGKNRISGLVLGMLIGDRSQIPKVDYQGFINSGLVHIIAVSGGNVVIITVFLGFILFFIPFYPRMFLVLLIIIFYGLICGLDSSVFRAVMTGGLSIIALFRGKEIPIRRLLSIAFVGMLVVNPYYLVYDVGFLMSFGAVIGIVLLSQKQDGKAKKDDVVLSKTKNVDGPLYPSLRSGGQKLGQYIRKNYLQPSVGATFGVFPIIIFFMGKINLLSIIANLFVLPILPFVMIYGFVSVYIYQLLGRDGILWLETLVINYTYIVSDMAVRRGLYLLVDGWVKWVILVGSIGFFVWWRSRSSATSHLGAMSRFTSPQPSPPGEGALTLYSPSPRGEGVGGEVKLITNKPITSSFP